MEYKKLEYHLSKPRLLRYLVASNNSQTRCHELYCANIKLSQAFYPVLSLFEVFFRNACHRQLTRNFANADWIIAEKEGFMNDPRLEGSRYFLKHSVLSAEKSIMKGRCVPTSEKIMGELAFGFWTSLFDPHHYKLVHGCVLGAFPNRPSDVDRKVLTKKLIDIREFRNRIYHNEPVCIVDKKVDVIPANTVRDNIYELLRWMDGDLPHYVNSFDMVPGAANYFNSL